MPDILTYVKSKILSVLKKQPVKHRLSVSDIFFANCKENELLRWDIAVKYLAIENYYGKNDFGFELYKKMQIARSGFNTVAAEEFVNNFKSLISSWENIGYDENSCIYVDTDLTLQNGAHRLAMAIYHNQKHINAYYLHRDKPSNFGKEFFIENNFSEHEIDLIKQKVSSLFDKLNTGFTCIIWAPAFNLTDSIIESFKKYGDVSDIRKHHYSKKDFETVVHKIYSVDNIAKWKIDKKLEFFKDFDTEFISFNLLLPYPDLQLNPVGDNVISGLCTKAKEAIQAEHKDKIDNYIYDIILHTCDNFYQSDFIDNLFSDHAVLETIYL